MTTRFPSSRTVPPSVVRFGFTPLRRPRRSSARLTPQDGVALEPIDMRKQIDGLAGAALLTVGGDPLSGHVFLFFNRRTLSLRRPPRFCANTPADGPRAAR